MERYYLNTDPIVAYEEICNDENYVDKTGLVAFVNSKMKKPRKLVLVSRPRRFGKTYAAVMLKAYYTIGYDTAFLFKDREISRMDPALANLGAFDVIYIDMLRVRAFAMEKQEKMDKEAAAKGKVARRLGWIGFLKESIAKEIADVYGRDVIDKESFARTLVNMVRKNGRKVVWICDEWDNFFREPTDDPNAKADYIELLRSLFKDKDICATVFAAAYMTGILPMIKMKGYSALTEFDNYTMFTPGDLAPYIGFTEKEVKDLLARNPGCEITYEEMAEWYEGYSFPGTGPIFNPKSVVEAIQQGFCSSYWNETDSREQFRELLALQNDGLRADVESLLRGEEVPVDSDDFDNDLATLPSRDSGATLAAMVHLGYLNFNQRTRCARIPNQEIRTRYVKMLKTGTDPAVYRKIAEADAILDATLRGEEQKVAEAFRRIHYYADPKAGNSEATLKETVDLAYYTAERFYVRMYELPTGEGYADIVLYPKPGKALPLMVIELKKDKAVGTGLDRIKERRYPDRFREYGGREMLLVAVSYDADKLEKEHYCRIERVQLPRF